MTSLQSKFKQQQNAYNQQPYASIKQRQDRLNILYKILTKHQNELIKAISADFNQRSTDETRLMEIMPSLSAIKYCLKHLKKWLKPEKRKISLTFKPSRGYVMYQPLGVVGIIVPWNYPLFLAIGPLCQALAAGNHVMLKMSEFTPEFSACFQNMISHYFSEDAVSVTTGGIEVAEQFSELPFNHLLFTGSTAVGQHIMTAASKNLTPVTLELGGKSPALLATDADLKVAAERIAYGKSVNSGQTCVAPDYVLLPETSKYQFIQYYFKALNDFYPTITDNQDYTHIINQKQFDQLNEYLIDAQQKGATIQYMSNESTQKNCFKHCVVLETTLNMKLMQAEIFGPILPILTYENLEDAVHYVNQRSRPLALYYFGHQPDQQQYVLSHTHSGGVCLNETLLHVGQEDLPFGGIGASGMGSYHGLEGFKTFSHTKSVFVRSNFSLIKAIYPPYGKWLHKKIYQYLLK